jgi:hypothetical protein
MRFRGCLSGPEEGISELAYQLPVWSRNNLCFMSITDDDTREYISHIVLVMQQQRGKLGNYGFLLSANKCNLLEYGYLDFSDRKAPIKA